ncbi:TetR/AcrR family transcriptional regulator [Ulvibacterium marinum]|uniref:TetR/AcrR family transcriptional regulator n=1 Tax=Ulvibacterium marinum TaxID=2419782 RepID=A0A3B0CH15_9FLAO|nr:TetR/AcrR family transcriptional regulator [Ulvibacterium marinum]RKN83537.1 TetR/AcrR family transcriptional regulator [Ulvibacterium marinum]
MKLDKLNRIFNATLNLTGKVGIAGLKMSSIAKEASMATGTLYLYFKNKKELLNALYFKLQKESAPALISEINHLPIEIQLYKMWSLALKRLVENNLRIIFLEQFLISPYVSESSKEMDARFRNYLRDLLDKGKKENQIKDVDSNILISLIIGFLRNFSTYIFKDKEGELSEKSIDESFSLCWEAIKK